MGDDGTSLPPFSAVVQGQGPREPSETRSRAGVCINLAKAAGLRAVRGAGCRRASPEAFTPGGPRVRSRVRVICSAASLGE